MADSDSDDELMSRLTSAVMASNMRARGEDCVHCGQPHATTLCTICKSAHYCNEVRSVVNVCGSPSSSHSGYVGDRVALLFSLWFL